MERAEAFLGVTPQFHWPYSPALLIPFPFIMAGGLNVIPWSTSGPLISVLESPSLGELHLWGRERTGGQPRKRRVYLTTHTAHQGVFQSAVHTQPIMRILLPE